MSQSREIAVLLSTTRHPASATPCAAHNDVVALQLARELAAGDPRALHYGDSQDPGLQDFLAFGAARIEVLAPQPGLPMAQALAMALADVAVILCGGRAEAGAATGLLPFELAGALACPVLTQVLEVSRQAQGVTAVQFLPRGRRRRIELPCPVVLAIHPLAPAAPRYAYVRRLAGVIETRPPRTDAVPAPAPVAIADWQPEAQPRQPLRLTGPDRRSGHARMAAAVESVARGGQVITDGTSSEQARAILSYVRRHGLIDR